MKPKSVEDARLILMVLNGLLENDIFKEGSLAASEALIVYVDKDDVTPSVIQKMMLSHK
tara:strand:- start:47 stop:223 length:177 start_codon:yes stop_codon:yes gene_type:complete